MLALLHTLSTLILMVEVMVVVSSHVAVLSHLEI